jgi:uncharacterized membrane protein YesL
VSRAETPGSPALPAAPRLGRVLRRAGEDLYYHGVRLVPANLAWGITFLVAVYLAGQSVLGLVIILALVPLTFGLMGMATIVVRERTLVMSDLARSIRTDFARRFALGLAQLALVAIAVVDLLIGLQIAGMIGLVLAVTAFYSGVAIWILAVAAWPIVMDPLRETMPLRARLRLALILVLAHPLRFLLLSIVLAFVLAASALLAAALITFAAAYAALVAAHYVLPAADRLEGRQTVTHEG